MWCEKCCRHEPTKCQGQFWAAATFAGSASGLPQPDIGVVGGLTTRTYRFQLATVEDRTVRYCSGRWFASQGSFAMSARIDQFHEPRACPTATESDGVSDALTTAHWWRIRRPFLFKWGRPAGAAIKGANR
jgi:hypothetical protein